MVKTPLPRMGLGMAALGRPGYINLDRASIFGSNARSIETMQSAANRVMDTLFEASEYPWLDCARSYGLSEKFVGEYLRAHKVSPGSVYVSSKWGYTYVADWKVSLESPDAKHEIKDHSTESFLKQVQESNEHLGEYIDLYQIHSATFDSGILDDTRAHDALAACRKERGWKLGLSVSGPDQDEIIRAARKISAQRDEDGKLLFDSVQCTFNLLEQKPRAALQEAAKAGMDIIIKEGLANGRALRHPAVKQYAEQLECEADALALGFVLAQDFAPRVLSGAVTSEQLLSNLKAMDVAEKLKHNPKLLAEIGEACAVKSEDYWTERAALAWN